jgi:hypothetical protein
MKKQTSGTQRAARIAFTSLGAFALAGCGGGSTPRGGVPGAAPAITAANVPPISAAPAAANQIGFSGTSLAVPN